MFGKRKSPGSRKKGRSLDAATSPGTARPAPVETLRPSPPPKRLPDMLAPHNRRASAVEPARSPGRTLVVGRDIALSGEVSDCDKLIVEGRLEGEVSETNLLDIREAGRVKGKAVVEACRISGSFEGELTVNGLLHLDKSARVRGTIRYAEVDIDRGGRLSGDIDSQRARAVKSSPARPADEQNLDGAAEDPPRLELAPGPGPNSV